MMPSTTKLSLLFVCLLSVLTSQAQVRTNQSSWYWLQTNYKLNKKNFVNAQYQLRLNHAPTQFGQSNFYLSFEHKFSKRWQAEVLYQYTTSFKDDQHTIYLGATRTWNLKPFKLFYRTAWQLNRNYYTGNVNYDNPYSEIRQRLRLQYPYKHFRFALSSEVYYRYNQNLIQHGQFSRLRNIALVSYNINKYQSVSAFYLFEPSLDYAVINHNDHVLGFVYQVNIPKKIKKLKNFFEKDKIKKNNPDQETNDSFN